MKVYEEEVFDILLGKVSSAINRKLLRAFTFENINITAEQWAVMSCLWKQDKVTQQTLCQLTAKDKPGMTRLIDNLEKRKLVVRVPHESDRRVNLIHLTRNGAILQEKATNIVTNIVDKTLEGISDLELNNARIVLKKIMHNLK